MAAVDDNWKKKEKEVWTVEGILPLRRCDAGDGQQVIGFVQFFWRPSADSYPPFLCSLVLCWTQKEEDNALNILSGYLVAAIERVSRRPQQSRGHPSKDLPPRPNGARTCGTTSRFSFFLSSILLFCLYPIQDIDCVCVCVS